MHRTQIYFDEPLFEALKREASTLGLSLSAYIREILKRELEIKKREKKSPDFSDFSGMWKERDIDQKSLREKAWK